MGPQLLQLPVPAHQGDDGLDVITLHRVVGDLVGPDESAGDAAVDEHETFATAMFDMLGTHHPLAGRGPVAGVDVEMLGAQARRAVVPIAPIAQRDNARPAVLAGEALVLGGSADGSASGSKKGIFNRSAGFRSLLTVRPRYAAGQFPGSSRARDRFTACSPSSGVGDYFRFLLHRGVSQPPDPDLDRVCMDCPGHCQPSLLSCQR